jgi:hypothetical protein
MADRFTKEIDLPDVGASGTVPLPPTGTVSIYGRTGKLAILDTAGNELLVERSARVVSGRVSLRGYESVVSFAAPIVTAQSTVGVLSVIPDGDADELEMDQPRLLPVPGAGSVTLYVQNQPGPVFGDYIVNCEVF